MNYGDYMLFGKKYLSQIPLCDLEQEVHDHYALNGTIEIASCAKWLKSEVWKNENGDFHRTGKPAIVRINHKNQEFLEWYLFGKRHREDGPAVLAPKREEWWLNGKLHRLDGPAKITKADGGFNKSYYVEGINIDPNDFELKK